MKRLLINIIVFFMYIFPSICMGATFYISPDGNDTNPGTDAAPFATFNHAFSVMQGGDTLYIKDGVYNQQIKNIPSGTAENYTKIYAVNDHQVDIDGQRTVPSSGWEALVWIQDTSYVEMRGLKIHHPGGSNSNVLDINRNSSHIIVRVCGIWEAANTKYGYPLRIGRGANNILIEDSWVFGTGRYTASISEGASQVIMRRVVARFDRGAFASEPIAGFAIYKGQNSILENCITLDHAGRGGVSTEHRGFQINSWSTSLPEAYNNSMYGCIAINNPDTVNGAFLINTKADTDLDNNLLENCVAVGNYRGFQLQSGRNTTIRNCTAINNISEGFRQNSTLSIGNFFYSNTSVGHASFGFINNNATNWTFDYNGYYGNNPNISGFSAGPNDRNDNPGILYPVRIELESTYSGSGMNGSGIGANVLKRYKNGVLTDEDLWPWPYEDWIKEDMCNPDFLAEVNRTGENAPDWAKTDKTLTEYIWEYLGNPIPQEIYGYEPAPPRNLSIP